MTRDGSMIMPYETVQYPRTNSDSGSEVSVHWSKDAHVQLKMQRHVWVTPAKAYDDMEDTPPQLADPPVGTVKATDSQIAYKIRDRVDTGNTGHPDEWVVVRLCGAVESCTGAQIEDWPVVYYPSDSGCIVPAEVWSEPLSRSEANRLIKVLRRARDDVFEPDA